MYMEKWRAKVMAGEIPANDFESRARKSKTGLIGADISFEGYFDRDNNPHDPTSRNIRAGAEDAPCLLYLVKNGLVFTAPLVNLFDVEISDDLETRADIVANGKTNGTFTYPGGFAPF